MNEYWQTITSRYMTLQRGGVLRRLEFTKAFCHSPFTKAVVTPDMFHRVNAEEPWLSKEKAAVVLQSSSCLLSVRASESYSEPDWLGNFDMLQRANWEALLSKFWGKVSGVVSINGTKNSFTSMALLPQALSTWELYRTLNKLAQDPIVDLDTLKRIYRETHYNPAYRESIKQELLERQEKNAR